MVVISFFALNAFSQQKRGDVIFAGQPHSFSILKIESGDSVQYTQPHSTILQNDKIIGISRDTLFFMNRPVRISEIKELRSSRNQYKITYIPASGQLVVPPASACSSPSELSAFKDKLSNDMGFSNGVVTEKTGVYRKHKLYRLLYLEHLPYYELYELRENQDITYSLPGMSQKKQVRISRIAGDTLFIDTLSYRFRQFSSLESTTTHMIGRAGFHNHTAINNLSYLKTDSASWIIIIPPDYVYKNIKTLASYDKSLRHRNSTLQKKQQEEPFVYPNSIRINLAKLLHLELAISYERIFNEHFGLETEVGAGIGVKGLRFESDVFQGRPVFDYNSFSFIVNPKYYYLGSRYYVGPVLMYKYLWFNNTGSRFFGSDNISTFTYLQDERRNDFGISIRVGRVKKYSKLIIDYYFGAGVKYVMLQVNDYGYYTNGSTYGAFHWANADHSPRITKADYFMPLFNVGIKIGSAF